MTTKKHAKKQHAPTAQKVSWIQGARLRTLPLAIAPVILGSAVAQITDAFNPVLAVLCVVLALSLQIGVNFANDYSDGVRGTDAHRVGPARLTGSGSASPTRVRAVAFAFFALGALTGIVITVLTQIWWLPGVGVVAILAAWFYTGGKRPYGYAGFGELFVFVFFGLVATIGTAYVQSQAFTLEALVAASGSGFLACAVLMVNNIRDIETDALSQKRTLAVRLGKTGAVIVFITFVSVAFIVVALVGVLYPTAWYAFFLLLVAIPVCLIVATARSAREYILALQLTSLLAVGYAVLLGLGFVL